MPRTEFSVLKSNEDTTDEVDDRIASWDSRRIYKNLLLISLAFLFVFTAFQALSNLQSSINCDEGLGLASLAAIYATLIVSGEQIDCLSLQWSPGHTFTHVKMSRNFKRHAGKFSRNGVLWGVAISWQLRGLWRCYGIYVVLIGRWNVHPVTAPYIP